MRIRPARARRATPSAGGGLVAGQVEQVVALVVGEAQRPGQRAEQLGRRLAAAALLEADDVVDRHAGEHGHLFPAQAGGAPAGAVGDADLGRADRLAAAAQEVGELVTLHDPMLPRGAAGAARERRSHDERSAPARPAAGARWWHTDEGGHDADTNPGQHRPGRLRAGPGRDGHVGRVRRDRPRREHRHRARRAGRRRHADRHRRLLRHGPQRAAARRGAARPGPGQLPAERQVRHAARAGRRVRRARRPSRGGEELPGLLADPARAPTTSTSTVPPGWTRRCRSRRRWARSRR